MDGPTFFGPVLLTAVVGLLASWQLWRFWGRRQQQALVAEAIKRAVASPVPAGKRALAIVNPSAGGRQGSAVFAEIVHPILRAAGVQLDTICTTGSAHVREIAGSLDARSLDCVFVVAGDGTVHELLNAYVRAGGAVGDFRETPLCFVPVGTCNMVSFSLGLRGPLQALDRALAVLRGEAAARELDMYQCIREAAPGAPLLDFSITCWASLADIDLDLERSRWVPSFLRESVLKHLVSLKHVLLLRSRQASIVIYPGKHGDPVDVSGEYYLVAILNVAWGDPLCHLAPGAEPNDGLVHVLLWRPPASRLAAALTFLAMETGGHLGRPGVSLHPARRGQPPPRRRRGFGDRGRERQFSPGGPPCRPRVGS